MENLVDGVTRILADIDANRTVDLEIRVAWQGGRPVALDAADFLF